MADPFIAEIRIVPFNFPPTGWAHCNGQIVPIIQNTALFALLGTTYGGDGATTFGLPDLRARVPMHPGHGAGLTPRVLGESAGSAQTTLLTTEIPQHDHGPVKAHGTAAVSGNVGFGNLATAAAPVYGPAVNLVPMGDMAGGGQPHENRQPYLALNFVIAMQGIFPVRPQP